jgi:hypothetical protein
MGFLRHLAEALLAGHQEPSRPPSRSARAFQWRCPCGASGRGYGDNQNDIECNADQHWTRAGQPHPLPYVVDHHGTVVSERIRHASGSVGRHWGWTD